MLLMSSGSNKEEPRYACLSEAKASHSQRMWAEVSSLTAHILHNGLSSSPSRYSCLLRALCLVSRTVTRRDEQRKKYSKMYKRAKDKLVRSPRENGGG